jgi:hypothetical protein
MVLDAAMMAATQSDSNSVMEPGGVGGLSRERRPSFLIYTSRPPLTTFDSIPRVATRDSAGRGVRIPGDDKCGTRAQALALGRKIEQ